MMPNTSLMPSRFWRALGTGTAIVVGLLLTGLLSETLWHETSHAAPVEAQLSKTKRPGWQRPSGRRFRPSRPNQTSEGAQCAGTAFLDDGNPLRHPADQFVNLDLRSEPGEEGVCAQLNAFVTGEGFPANETVWVEFYHFYHINPLADEAIVFERVGDAELTAASDGTIDFSRPVSGIQARPDVQTLPFLLVIACNECEGGFEVDNQAVTAYDITPLCNWCVQGQGTSEPPESSGGESHEDEPTALGSIRGLAFIDLNANGLLEADEPGLNDVDVYLQGGGLDLVSTTPATGMFSFDGLGFGEYDVFIAPGSEWRITTQDRYGAVGVTGDTVLGIDFGLSRVGDSVAASEVAGSQLEPASAPRRIRLPSTGASTPKPPIGVLAGLAVVLLALSLFGFAGERRRVRRFD